MELTKNLNLKKPAENDFYNVADFNENADILDTEVQALKDGKFDKTGGTINGSIVTSGHISKVTDNSSLNVFGASGFAKGAELSLYGKDSTKAGVWELVAHNGDTYGKLEGSPTGSLLWNGNDVITAKGGTLNGTLNSKALGGQATLAGYGGCQLWLLSKDDTTNKGGFILRTIAESGGGFVDFVGRYDGTLKWNGKDVITSAGGTFTGNIKTSNSTSLIQTTDSSNIGIFGGTAYNKGAYGQFHGKDHADAGQFFLVAHNGTNSSLLIGKPDGTLTWGGNNVITSAGGKFTGEVHLSPPTGEGGEIHLDASDERTSASGIVMDNNNGLFRVFGIPSKDGTTRTGVGTTLTYDPYTQKLLVGNKAVAVVDYWRSGSNWYRKWSDGFIEQGGYHGNDGASGTNVRTCTLHTAFTTTYYQVFRASYTTGNDAGSVQPRGWCAWDKTTTSYKYSYPVNWTHWQEDWYACGY